MKATKLIRILLCVALSLMSAFLAVGYAALTTELRIEGEAEWNEPAAIYIVNVTVNEYDNIRNGSPVPSVNKAGFLVFQHGPCELNRQGFQANYGGYITVKISVKNNSGVPQYFLGQETPALDEKCTMTVSGIKPGTRIADGDRVTLYIKFQYAQTSGSLKINGEETTLLFSPVFDESYTENASKSLAEIFQNVLANKGPDGEGSGIVYQGQNVSADRIMQVMTDNMESVDTGGYIGNVGNASQEQKDLITAIFGDNISMQLGNQTYSVSLLIKNQQIDGRGQNDMVMYVTADQLAVGGGEWNNGAWQKLNNVPVYGMVFIRNDDGSYTYCEHLFEGVAPVCSFGGDLGANYVGNFNTNLWNSTEYPDLTDTSGGVITESYSTTNGELDEAYQRYVLANPR